jgi:hypothetical protein
VIAASFASTPSGVLPWPTNADITPGGPITTLATPGVGSLRLAPLYIPNTIRLAGIAIETTVAGDAGSIVRVGLWAPNANGFPNGAPVTGSGGSTAPTDQTPGFQTAAFNQVIPAGLYWAGAVLENVTTVQPTVRNTGAGVTPMAISALAALNAGYLLTGVTAGSLPTLAGTALAAASSVYRLVFVTGTP